MESCFDMTKNMSGGAAFCCPSCKKIFRVFTKVYECDECKLLNDNFFDYWNKTFGVDHPHRYVAEQVWEYAYKAGIAKTDFPHKPVSI